MFKQCIKRKMIITSLALILLMITLTFPKTEDNLENITITYQKGNTSPLYLMNEDNLVARTNIPLKNEERITEICGKIVNDTVITVSNATELKNALDSIATSTSNNKANAKNRYTIQLNSGTYDMYSICKKSS